MGSIAEETRWLDATAQAELVASGEVKAVELGEAAIERIEASNDALNAVVIRWFEHGLEVAAGIDAYGSSQDDRAPFAGVPFLLKDLWAHYAGQVLTNGNQALKEAQPVSNEDTTIVERFNQAGLVTLGRTNSPELGSVPVTEPVAYGPTRNPWDISRTPGGSSGGAAAAVASGMVPIAHASDGGGSIRIPASCCGLVGLKTSQGRISVGPHRSETGLGVELCVSRSVRDTARLLDATYGPGVGDTVIAPAPNRPYVDELAVDPPPLRVGLLDHNPRGGDIHPEVAQAARAAGALMESLGHSVEAAYPEILADNSLTQQFMALWATQMEAGVDAYAVAIGRPLTEDEVETPNWAQAQFAKSMSAGDLARAQGAAVRARRSIQQWWADGWDLLITPTLGDLPLPIGALDPTPEDPMVGVRAATAFVPFTPPFNISGQPAISLPLGLSADGLPIGVQFVAAYGREDLLLQVAAGLEQANPWNSRHPTG